MRRLNVCFVKQDSANINCYVGKKINFLSISYDDLHEEANWLIFPPKI